MDLKKNEKRGKKILVLSDYYLPGYKSGGGMRTIVNMIERLGNIYEFFVITRDHDGKLDREPYKSVKINKWNYIQSAKVFYCSKSNIRISTLRDVILEVDPDVIYSNSYFATFTFYLLILRRLRKIPPVNIIIAPCGELSEGALQLNTLKKKAFFNSVKITNLYKNIIWKASSELEKQEIKLKKGSGGEIFIAPDMLPATICEDYDFRQKSTKFEGNAKMAFLSRFMRKKNFNWLLKNLTNIEGKLEIDIYGPLEDAKYWEESKEILKTLPKNIIIQAKGSVPHEKVAATLVKYHFFIMPTLGENFGHVFLEALAVGCPLIISDQTPWLDLEEKEIGWDLSLNEPRKWIEKLNYCIALNQKDYGKLSSNARTFANAILNDKKIEEDTLRILNKGLGLI